MMAGNNSTFIGLQAVRNMIWTIFAVFFVLLSQMAFADVDTATSGETTPPKKRKAVVQPIVSKLSALGIRTNSLGSVGFAKDKEWRILPGFKFGTTYDSNINREKSGERDHDIILHHVPSIEVRRSGTRFKAGASYEMDYEQYLKDSDQSGFNHIADIGLAYTGERLKTNFSQNLSFAKAYASNEQVERRQIFVSNTAPEVIYKLTPKLSASALYNSYIFDYRESILKDSSYWRNGFGGRVYYHATPKLDFYTEGLGSITNYYHSSQLDHHGFSVKVGSTGVVTPKLSVNAETGYNAEYYDEELFNNFHNWVVNGAILYRLTPRIDVSLRGERSHHESVYRTTGWYQAHLIGLNVGYRIANRIKLILDSYYQRNSYPSSTTEGRETNKKRLDDVFGNSAEIQWGFYRDFMFSVRYDLRNRTSNFDDIFDYVSHKVDAAVSYKFS